VLKSRNQKHDQVNHNAKECVRYEDVGINGVCHQVETHNIVTIGEIHGNKQEYEWLRSPVGTPDFADRVDDVVMEFGNSLYQKSVDYYIAGVDVPRATEPDVPEDGPLQHTLNDTDAALQEHGRISRQIGFSALQRRDRS